MAHCLYMVPLACWRRAQTFLFFLWGCTGIWWLFKTLSMLNNFFFFSFLSCLLRNFLVKYIECALCWESVWENKSDFGAKQNLISLGSCAHQRVFSHGDFAGRAVQRQQCVTAWEELCCWPGALRRQGLFPCSTTAQAHGAQEFLLRAFCTFQSRDFYLPLSAPGARGGAANRKPRQLLDRGVRGCCYLVSLLRCIWGQLSLPSWKWTHKS